MRAAFVTTLDSLLRYSLDPDSVLDRPIGFMSCYPMLNGMAPQIQMECLTVTWNNLHEGNCAGEGKTADLLDEDSKGFTNLLNELVIYAAYDALAKITSERQSHALKVVFNGPQRISERYDHWLYAKTRCLQTISSGPLHPHFLRELGDILDPGPWFDAGIDRNWCESREELMSLVGRWVAHKDLILGSNGLLTLDEIGILRAFFEEHPGLGR